MMARDQAVKSRVAMAVETYGNIRYRFQVRRRAGTNHFALVSKTSLMERRSLVIRCRRRNFEIDHSELPGCPNVLETLDCEQ